MPSLNLPTIFIVLLLIGFGFLLGRLTCPCRCRTVISIVIVRIYYFCCGDDVVMYREDIVSRTNLNEAGREFFGRKYPKPTGTCKRTADWEWLWNLLSPRPKAIGALDVKAMASRMKKTPATSATTPLPGNPGNSSDPEKEPAKQKPILYRLWTIILVIVGVIVWPLRPRAPKVAKTPANTSAPVKAEQPVAPVKVAQTTAAIPLTTTVVLPKTPGKTGAMAHPFYPGPRPKVGSDRDSLRLFWALLALLLMLALCSLSSFGAYQYAHRQPAVAAHTVVTPTTTVTPTPKKDGDSSGTTNDLAVKNQCSLYEPSEGYTLAFATPKGSVNVNVTWLNDPAIAAFQQEYEAGRLSYALALAQKGQDAGDWGLSWLTDMGLYQHADQSALYYRLDTVRNGGCNSVELSLSTVKLPGYEQSPTLIFVWTKQGTLTLFHY